MSAERHHVLIVDDSVEDRLALRRILTKDDSYTIGEADCGSAAIDYCRRHATACVLLDFNLPDLDGVEVIQRLKSEFSTMAPAVVMLTGAGNEALAVAAMKSGAKDYLVKGFAKVGATDTIRSAIETAVLRQQVERQDAVLEAQRLELLDASRMKDQFLATLAHELRNPLAPIGISATALSRRHAHNPEVARLAAIIQRQVWHLGRLVEDLLDVARLGNGKVQLRRDRESLATILDAVVEICAPIFEDKKQELVVHAPGHQVFVQVDRLRLVQSLANVVANASKFSAAGQTVELTAGVRGGLLSIRVKDRGIGLEGVWLERVFDMFAQGVDHSGNPKSGLGIGLNLAKRFVEMHDGTLTAHSDGLGLGSEFEFLLPVLGETAEGDPPGQTPASSTAQPSARRRVLVVEDNPDISEVLVAFCQDEGFEVEAAGDGLAAVALAERFEPDIVLMDIGLPGIDGYESVRRIHRLPTTKRPLTIAITGWGDDVARQTSAAAGFDHHMVKPVDMAMLMQFMTTAAVQPSTTQAAKD